MTRNEYISKIKESFTVLEVLSTKNNCQVLQLRHRQTGKDMVLRSYPQQVMAYEELVSVSCDALPEIYDSIILDDGHVVLEEYIRGATISDVMKAIRFTKLGARNVMLALCHAMEVLHSRAIVHRDIKPENVMIADEGRVVLIDFNASRRTREGSQDTVVMGTVGYVSPEQLGISQTDARTDIYAAGVLYNVMLTGEHPSVEIASGKAGRIVRKCTAINPNERYQSATALYAAL